MFNANKYFPRGLTDVAASGSASKVRTRASANNVVLDEQMAQCCEEGIFNEYAIADAYSRENMEAPAIGISGCKPSVI